MACSRSDRQLIPSDRTLAIASTSGIMTSEAIGRDWGAVGGAHDGDTCCASSSSGLLATYTCIVVRMSLCR